MPNQDSPKEPQPNKLTKIQRQAGRQRVESYHQKKLAELMFPVRQAMDAFDRAKIDAFALDYIIQVYVAQSQELYEFINSYYGSNNKLPELLALIDLEEQGEWSWVAHNTQRPH